MPLQIYSEQQTLEVHNRVDLTVLAFLLLQAPEFLKEKADIARFSDLRASFEEGWQRIIEFLSARLIVGAWDNLAYWEHFKKLHF